MTITLVYVTTPDPGEGGEGMVLLEFVITGIR